jgi:hemoglobin/transferrin/lactoferrin receptor protein
MKKYILFCLSLGSCLFARAQTITIKDMETNAPVAQVILTNQSTGAFITTNLQGQADLLSVH